MHKKIWAAALLLAMLLSLAACGGGTAGGEETKNPAGAASQPAQGPGEATSQPTKGTGGENAQPTEETGPAGTRYIFSDRPAAAFEVTGFDLHSIYDGPYTDVEGYSYELPLVKLTPGENSLIIFCMQAERDIAGSNSTATIHSPAGSSPWEGRTYSCFDMIVDPVPEGYALFYQQDYSYGEGDYDGGYLSLMDAILSWISFSELYHPDAAQDDSICVVDVAPYPDFPGIDTVEGVVAAVADTLAGLGGAVTEIPVDEALARCHAEVE